jgi:aromatic ring hydroxylase
MTIPTEKEEEDFKNNVSQLSTDVMDALYRHRPEIIEVVECLTQVLGGVILQIPSDMQDHMRKAIVDRISYYTEENSVEVNMLDRLSSAKH